VSQQGFEVKVTPRAGREEIAGERDGCVLVRVLAAPTDGKANEAVRRLIAARLSVPLADVELLRGERSRRKTVSVAGLAAADARRRLLADP
jgi:uncharacterized protein (TIGR00251 family)